MLLYILYAHPNFTNPANWDNTRHSRLDQSRGAIVGPVHLGQRLSQCILLWWPTGHHYGPFGRTDQIHGGGNLVLARLALKIQEHYGHWQCGTRESPPKKTGVIDPGFQWKHFTHYHFVPLKIPYHGGTPPADKKTDERTIPNWASEYPNTWIDGSSSTRKCWNNRNSTHPQ